MKKIKKILPLLLGVMVLMFGTLTVSAAEISAQAKADYNAFYQYCIERKIELGEYQIYDSRYRQLAFMSTPGTYNKNLQAIQNSKIAVLQYDNDGNVILRYASDMYSSKAWQCCLDYLISSYDITDGTSYVYVKKDTTNFFPHPVVAPVTALPEMVQNQTRVILITAVACLALLVILSVLPKKLPRFLNR